jgi:sugar lactone lactonase YvrE
VSGRRELAGGWAFAESPRWHDGRVWVSTPFANRVLAIDLDGRVEEVCEVPHPMGLGWLPDRRLLAVSMSEWAIYSFDGSRVERYCDLSVHCVGPPNDVVVDRQGRAYVGNMGAKDFIGGEPPRPADLVLVDADARPRAVAPDLMFANGLALSEDGRTLIVAETFASLLTAFDVDPADGSLAGRRVFAALDEKTPDGIALDAEGAVWVASMETCEVLRVREGGEVTHRIELDGRNTPACMLGGPERRTLFLVTLQNAAGVTDPTEGLRRGDSVARVEVVEAPAPAPGTGLP